MRSRAHILYSTLRFMPQTQIVLLACGICLSICAGATLALLPTALGNLYQDVRNLAQELTKKEVMFAQVCKHIRQTIGLATSSWLFHSSGHYIWTLQSEREARSFRDKGFQALLWTDTARLDALSQGSAAFVAQISADVLEYQQTLSQALSECCSIAVAFSIYISQALWYAWDLAMITLAIVLLFMAAITRSGQGHTSELDRHRQDRLNASACTLAALSNIETVKCFNGQQSELQRYGQLIDSAASSYLRHAKTRARQLALTICLSLAMFIVAFAYAGRLVASGAHEPGDIIAAFFATLGALRAIQAVPAQRAQLVKGKAAHDALLSAIDVGQVKQYRYPTATCLERMPLICHGAIAIKDLDFYYPCRPDDRILSGLCLTIPSGATLFVVGENGSGKSTLAQLLIRLYSPAQGGITLDDHPLADLDVTWLRKNVLLIGQDHTLSCDSILQNIDPAHEPASETGNADLTMALDFALLVPVVARLQNGLHTVVGDCGTALSPGQRQLVALARARLHDPPVLILDEATSALDPGSRAQVMNNLRQWRRDRSTIIITHDTTHIESQDCVCVLKNGSLIDQGQWRKVKQTIEIHPARSSIQPDTPPGGLDGRRPDCSSQLLPDFVPRTLNDTKVQSGGSALLPDSPEDSWTDSTIDTHEQRRPMLRILRTVWPCLELEERNRLLAGMMGATIHAFASPLFSCVLAQLLRTLHSSNYTKLLEGSNGNAAQQRSIVLVMIAVAAVDTLIVYIYKYSLEHVAQAWTDHIRRRAFQNLLDQPQSFYNSQTMQGNLAHIGANLDHDAERMRDLLGSLLAPVYIATLMCFVSLAWTAATDAMMTVAVILLVPIIIISVRTSTKATELMEQARLMASDRATAIFSESMSTIKTVRALTLEIHVSQEYRRATNNIYDQGRQRALYIAALHGLRESTMHFGVAFVFYVGARFVMQGSDGAHIVQVIVMLLFAVGNAAAILSVVPQIASSLEAAQRVFTWVDLPRRWHDDLDGIELDLDGPIRLEEVTFAYPNRPNEPVLRDVTVCFDLGKTTAIVGAPGSGKSTIGRLLLGFYRLNDAKFALCDRNSGRIMLGRHDIREIHPATLRRLIVTVPQTSRLMSGSVYDNITYGLPIGSEQRSLSRVITAAEQAGAHGFISSLPQGYHTPVGVDGTDLSGGQRQSVAIARALLREPSVLILDEATSALDSKRAQILTESLRAMRCNRGTRDFTVILITHHQELAEMADCVVRLECGRVASVQSRDTYDRRCPPRM